MESIDLLYNTMLERFDRVDKSVDRIDDRLEQHEKRERLREEQFAALTARMDTTERDVRGLKKRPANAGAVRERTPKEAAAYYAKIAGIVSAVLFGLFQAWQQIQMAMQSAPKP